MKVLSIAWCLLFLVSAQANIYNEIQKLYFQAEEAVTLDELPIIKADENSLKCVYVYKKEPMKTLERTAILGRYVYGTEEEDPVLGPNNFSFAAGPQLYNSYLKNDTYIFPDIDFEIENEGTVLHTKFYRRKRTKDYWNDYVQTRTIHLFVRKNQDGVYFFKSNDTYTKKGRGTYVDSKGDTWPEDYDITERDRVNGYCYNRSEASD